MTGTRRALLAAAAVEAAAGVLAALIANAWGDGHSGDVVFATCTAGAAIADMVLVPGWVWAPYPSVPLRLLRRAVLAVLTVVAAIWTALLLLAFGNLAFQVPWQNVYIIATLGVVFLAAGAVAGLGAKIAEIWDKRLGLVQTHVAGGMAGVLLVSALAATAGTMAPGGDPPSSFWWPLFVLAPLTLMLGGGIRNVLIARDAMRAGTALADPGPMAGRVVASCALCLALAVAAASCHPDRPLVFR